MKPCPRCERDPVFVRRRHHDEGRVLSFYWCSTRPSYPGANDVGCGLTGPAVYTPMDSRGDKPGAQRAWNAGPLLAIGGGTVPQMVAA